MFKKSNVHFFLSDFTAKVLLPGAVQTLYRQVSARAKLPAIEMFYQRPNCHNNPVECGAEAYPPDYLYSLQ